MASSCFKGSSTTAPLLYSLVDTFYTDLNYGIAWTTLKAGTNLGTIGAEYAMYNSRFVIDVWYVTTTTDHLINDNNYFQNVLGAKFMILISTALANNSISEPTSGISLSKSGSNNIKIHSEIQRNINLTMYDLVGRKVANLYSGPAKESITLPQSTSNTYLFQLKAAKEKYTMNANIIK